MNSQLNILFITDIHLSFIKAQKLAKWHIKNGFKFDVILIGGDTANCDQNHKFHNEQQQLFQANKILIQIQNIFNTKMFFIPGNHDPIKHYQKNHKISPNIESIHQRNIMLSQGLQIIGFGGSVPGYLDKQIKQQVWQGYPFNSNQQHSQYCTQNKIFQNSKSQNQIIYLTHCGPFSYQTSINRRDPNSVIYGGAKYYDSLIENQNLLIYLHGHVHAGSKYAKVKQVPIINPGPLSTGQFGYLKLVKNTQTKKWILQSTHFVQL